MTSPLPANTSQTARLINGGPSMAVGWQEPVYVPQPAAGATWKYVTDGRFYERVISVRWKYSASAVVTNRYPLLTWRDANGTIVLRSPAMQIIVAGNNSTMNSRFNGYADFGQNQAEQFSDLPDLLLPPDWSVAGDVIGIDAGDQISGVILVVQRFPSDAAVMPVTG